MSLTLFSFVVSTHIIASDKNAVHENLTHEHLNQFKSFEIRFCLGLATNLPFTHGSESIEPQAWGPYYFHSHWKLLPELTLGSLPFFRNLFTSIYFRTLGLIPKLVTIQVHQQNYWSLNQKTPI